MNPSAHPMFQDDHEAPWGLGQFPKRALQSMDTKRRAEKRFQLLKEGGCMFKFFIHASLRKNWIQTHKNDHGLALLIELIMLFTQLGQMVKKGRGKF